MPSKPWKVVSAGILSALLLFGQTAPVLGNPTGGQVVAGSANITNAGSTLTINQGSDKAIITWQNFSINSGELTKFLVPNSSSATLNRVLGGNPSAIYGTLQSNGQLFLVNPNGIVVGAGGRIDTAGFLGSTLDVSNSSFLNGGDLHFLGTSGAGINNQGVIHAASGDVYLIANQVSNSGTLSAPQGNVGLAAGSDVLLQQAGDQHLFVQPILSGTSATTGITNTGAIQAATAELKAAGGNAYALAINNTGNIAATGFKKVNGQVFLTADGGNITNAGQISAQNPNGDGGTIVLNGHGTSSAGTVLNSGKLVASGKTKGAKGGTVNVLGNKVGIVDHGVVDVSGDAGGGTALIGGDEHGANPSIPNAEQTYVGPDAQITADALTFGNGGKIVLWGNQTTQAYGQLSVRGGAASGNGGFVETSAPTLDVRGVPNTSASHGKGGTWLLDPSDILISDNVTTTSGFNAPFTISIGSIFDLDQADLLAALVNGDVTLDASNGSGGNGTITWTQPNGTVFDISSIVRPNATLTLNAPTQILLSGITIDPVASLPNLSLVLNSSGSSGNVQILNSLFQLNGGSVTIYGTGFASTSSSTSMNNSDGIYISNSLIDAQGGSINLTGNAGYYFNNAPTYNAVTGGVGVHVDHSVIQTTGAGSITMVGNGGIDPLITSVDYLTGVEIGNASAVSVSSGNISITGTVNQGTATGILFTNPDLSQGVQGGDSVGVAVVEGSLVEATGSGSVAITGNTSGSTAMIENIGVYLAGGNGNLGQSNFSPSSPTTTTVSAAGGAGITITGTGGTLANSFATSVNIQTPEADGVRLDNGVAITATSSAPITLMGTGGTDTNNNPNVTDGNAGGIEIDAYGSSGNNGTSNDNISSASGTILLTGIGGSSMNGVNGISLDSDNGGLSSITSSSGNITLNGSVPNQTATQLTSQNGVTGVNLGGHQSAGSFSSITALAGSINITGTVSSGTDNSEEGGVVITSGSQVSAQGSGGVGALARGDVTLIGDTTGSTALSLDGGVFIEGSSTQVSATGTTANGAGYTGLTILGTSSTLNGTTGATINHNSNNNVITNPGIYLNPVTSGIAVINGATLKTTGSAAMTLTGVGGTDSNSDPTSDSYGVAFFSPTIAQTTGISAGTGLVSITGTGGSSPNTGYGLLMGGPSNVGTVSVAAGGTLNATALSNTGLYLNATITAASTALGSGPAITSGTLQIEGGSIILSGGNFTAYGQSTVASVNGIDITNTTINTGGGSFTADGIITVAGLSGVSVSPGSSIITGGGNMSFTGQGTGGGSSYGIKIGDFSGGGATLNAGTGSLVMSGVSGSNVFLDGTVTAHDATLGNGTGGDPSTVTSGSLQIEKSTVTLSGGDLIGYGAGTSNSVDGVDIFTSTINTEGGNIVLAGKSGFRFDATAGGNISGWGVFIGANSVLENTASNQNFTSGSITIDGDGSQALTVLNDLTGVEIFNSKLSVVNGALSVIGNVNSGTTENINSLYVSYTSGFGDGAAGVLIDGGSSLASTGSGTLNILGDASGSISDASGSITSDHDNSGVHITGSNTTISSTNGAGIIITGIGGAIINNPLIGASKALDVSIGPFQASGIPTLNAGTGSLVIDPVVIVNGISVVANITAGTTSLVDAGQEVDLFNSGGSSFGILNLIAGSATVYQSSPIILGVISVTNNLTILSGGDVTQIGPISTSQLSVASGGAINLINIGNSITQLGQINHVNTVAISSGGSPLLSLLDNSSQTFPLNVMGTPYSIDVTQVNNIPALGVTIQAIGNQIPIGAGNLGGGTTTGQQVATILPVNNQIDPNAPSSGTILVTDSSSLVSDVSFNPKGGGSPIFQNLSTLSGASSGDADVGPGDVVQVAGGTVDSTKATPAITSTLQGALNNQVQQDLVNALQG